MTPSTQREAPTTPQSRRLTAAQRVVYALLAAHVFFPLLWVVHVAQVGPRQNDWREFQVAAEHFVSGRWQDLYSLRLDSVLPGYLWLYPPFALYVVAPLAWLQPSLAYVVVAGTGAVALVGSLLILSKVAPIRERPAWAMAVALSAPALATIITGQISALILLCIAGAALLWTRGRPIAAGALLGLLAFKPNLGIFFGLYLIVRREWRGVAAMFSVVSALCASTLPLGRELWKDFIRISLTNVNVFSQHEPYKMITLKAFLETLFGEGPISQGLWLTTALCLTAVAAWAWRQPGRPLRHLGLVVLLALVANPYGFFYDGLLLAVPATAWWTERDAWRRDRWLFTGGLIAAAWCWEQYSYNWIELLKATGVHPTPPFSPVGPIAAVWLLVASLEAQRGTTSLVALHGPGKQEVIGASLW